MKKWVRRLLGTMGSLLLAFGVLTGCGGGDDNNKDNGDAKQEEKEQNKEGSRSNPVPLQKTHTISDELYDDEGNSYKIKFDLTVTEAIRGDAAYKRLVQMNQFNEKAPEGYEWVLAKTKVKFTESETENESMYIDGVMNFEMVSESGDIYSGDIVGTTDPDFAFEMYVGTEKEGYIAGLVKTGEKASLRYDEMIGEKVFFALE